MKPKLTIVVLLVIAALICGTMVSAHVYVPDFTSKYVNPADSDVGTGGGHVYVSLRSQNNPFDSPLIIYRVNTNLTFTNGQKIGSDIAKNLIGDMSDNMTVDLGLGGRWDDILTPGQFVIELVDGDRGNPEFAFVNVAENGEYHISFLGHAASGDLTSSIITPSTKSPITIISANYVGVWNSANGHYGLDGHESAVTQIQKYLDANPTVTTFDVYASVGQIFVNGFDVMAPADKDPAQNWVKTLEVSYSYKDSHNHIHYGGFLIAENDAGSYNDNLLKILPESGTISI